MRGIYGAIDNRARCIVDVVNAIGSPASCITTAPDDTTGSPAHNSTEQPHNQFKLQDKKREKKPTDQADWWYTQLLE